jgi:Mor family transcriptional regulator
LAGQGLTVARRGNKRLYQFIDDLVAIGTRELMQSAELQEIEAKTLMTSIAHAMCHQHARTQFYVPAVLEIELDERDECIWSAYCQDGPDGVMKFTKARVEQLAEEHKLTPRHMYSVISLARRRDQARRQPALPGLEPTEGS